MIDICGPNELSLGVLKADIKRPLDRPLCYTCGGLADEIHHIKPKRAGGDDTPSNLMPLCISCHNLVDRNKLEYMMDIFLKEKQTRFQKIYGLKLISILYEMEANAERKSNS